MYPDCGIVNKRALKTKVIVLTKFSRIQIFGKLFNTYTKECNHIYSKHTQIFVSVYYFASVLKIESVLIPRIKRGHKIIV